jgi:hypothetical protein
MKKVKIGKYQVELHDSIDELSMSRFHKYNKMLLIDAGIGSDLSDFDARIEKARVYCTTKAPELALMELDNLRQTVYFIQSELSPKHLAFCILIKSIDGEEKNDLSVEGLQKTLEMFADVPNKDLTDHMDTVKKKIDEELQTYFPSLFDDSTIKEYYDDLKKRTILMLQAIIKGGTDEAQAEIDKITIALITYNKPNVFSGSDNMEIQHDKSFENMCLLISQKLHVDAKKQTVLEFYNAFEYIKDMMKAESKRNKAK